jgi:phosphate transport system substrate-binding protein
MTMLTNSIRALIAAAAVATSALAHADITGAGATFPFPIYAKWADAYKKQGGFAVNYQSIGSGGGIRQITAKTVDFGASDLPMSAADLEKNGLVQFPAIIGGVVPVVNLPGVPNGELKFTGELLSDIYGGKIKKWNDPALAALNPGIKLPDQAITAVYRSDGSGTTFLFTNYLSKTSANWKNDVGEGSSVKWPTGVGGKGNEGVASYVQKLPGSIGYVEFAYAKQNKLNVGQMRNKDGAFVKPTDDAFKAAASGAEWAKAPGMGVILTDQPGKASWPISGASFILVHKKQDKPEQGKKVLAFFDWSFKNGKQMADDLDYVPMPDDVVSMIRNSWKVVQ